MNLLLSLTFLWSSVTASSLAIGGRISNGFSAAEGDFPYMVYIERKSQQKTNQIINVRYICGGSLISNQWILTAAHCVDGSKPFTIHIYLGMTNTDNVEVGYALWSSHAVHIHPLFHRESSQNDIALIKIPDTPSCSKIRPVRLPPLNPSRPNSHVGEIGIAVGWGKTSSTSRFPGRLQFGPMKIIQNEYCRHFKPWMSNTQICLDTSKTKYSAICVGDSGGPFVLQSTDELVGVVSSFIGPSCDAGYPSILTRITPYLQWIKSKTGIYY